MCLIITAFAAVAATLVWYFRLHGDGSKLGALALAYWGASLMWSVDGVFSVMQGGPFFDTSADDALLGVVIVLCGLIAWIVMLLYSDPKNVLVSLLHRSGAIDEKGQSRS